MFHQAVKEGSDPMILNSVILPLLTNLAEKSQAKTSIEALKKDFEAVEKVSPGFTHNFVAEILDLMKSKK